ncbi:hypothetical protein [Dysgonomonas reticulitermitis]
MELIDYNPTNQFGGRKLVKTDCSDSSYQRINLVPAMFLFAD